MAKRKSRLKFCAVVCLHVVVVLGIFLARATPPFWFLMFLVFLEGMYFGRLSCQPPLLRDPAYDNREHS
ncbi:hypothetical protein MLDJOKPK_00251 [Salmonella phage SPAsTU]|nr:hypothetical protein STsAS_161 [Salmonella phage STsAS]AWN09149.1 hypothetical protein MLDJOKPK_00251 [Salmonella phage SPAsTU]